MHLIQILLPLYDNAGEQFAEALYQQVQAELTAQFDGLTVYSRSPAEGLWSGGKLEKQRDDVILFEVVTETLDRPWWQNYRRALEVRFQQEVIHCRAQDITLL